MDSASAAMTKAAAQGCCCQAKGEARRRTGRAFARRSHHANGVVGRARRGGGVPVAINLINLAV
jgi:hypothetical protein